MMLLIFLATEGKIRVEDIIKLGSEREDDNSDEPGRV